MLMILRVFRALLAARTAPAVARAAEAVARALGAAVARGGTMTLLAWLHFFRATKALRTEIESRALALALEGRLPGWMVLTNEKRTLNPQIVAEVVREIHGPAAAAEACPLTTSKKAINAALKPRVERGGMQRATEAVIAEVTLRGGVEVRSWPQLCLVGEKIQEGEGE